MRFLKLFLLYAQIILEAKNLFILVEKYCPRQMDNLLRKLYRALPDKKDLPEEEEFVRLFVAWFLVIDRVVKLLWFLFPSFMHSLTWKYLDLCQEGWTKFFKLFKVYVQESEETITSKIQMYSKLYKEKVLLNLLEKDFEAQIALFDYWLRINMQKEIKKLQEHFESTSPGPKEGENWLFMIDSDGIHENPNWDIRK
ncbi:MAG: hypothetical protein N2Z84_04090 [Atribacterota bacterium]|nr:hypothetical protein [Atribacterota bacterium]